MCCDHGYHDLAGGSSGIFHRHRVVEDQCPQQPDRFPDGEFRSTWLWKNDSNLCSNKNKSGRSPCSTSKVEHDRLQCYSYKRHYYTGILTLTDNKVGIELSASQLTGTIIYQPGAEGN